MSPCSPSADPRRSPTSRPFVAALTGAAPAPGLLAARRGALRGDRRRLAAAGHHAPPGGRPAGRAGRPARRRRARASRLSVLLADGRRLPGRARRSRHCSCCPCRPTRRASRPGPTGRRSPRRVAPSCRCSTAGTSTLATWPPSAGGSTSRSTAPTRRSSRCSSRPTTCRARRSPPATPTSISSTRRSPSSLPTLMPGDWRLAFQSKGRRGGEWLEPEAAAAVREFAAAGWKNLLVVPLGFVADHVETLYDFDVELRAGRRGLRPAVPAQPRPERLAAVHRGARRHRGRRPCAALGRAAVSELPVIAVIGGGMAGLGAAHALETMRREAARLRRRSGLRLGPLRARGVLRRQGAHGARRRVRRRGRARLVHRREALAPGARPQGGRVRSLPRLQRRRAQELRLLAGPAARAARRPDPHGADQAGALCPVELDQPARQAAHGARPAAAARPRRARREPRRLRAPPARRRGARQGRRTDRGRHPCRRPRADERARHVPHVPRHGAGAPQPHRGHDRPAPGAGRRGRPPRPRAPEPAGRPAPERQAPRPRAGRARTSSRFAPASPTWPTPSSPTCRPTACTPA